MTPKPNPATRRSRRHRRAALRRLDDLARSLSDSELNGLQWDIYEAIRRGHPSGVARLAVAALDLLSGESGRRGSPVTFDTGDAAHGPPPGWPTGPESYLPY